MKKISGKINVEHTAAATVLLLCFCFFALVCLCSARFSALRPTDVAAFSGAASVEGTARECGPADGFPAVFRNVPKQLDTGEPIRNVPKAAERGVSFPNAPKAVGGDNRFPNASGVPFAYADTRSVSGGQSAVLILVGIFGGGALVALLIFMLVFPVLNRLFGTRLPGYAMFDREYVDEDAAEADARAEKPGRAARKPSGAQRKKKADPAGTPVAGGAGYTDDRPVKTVRIDTLYNPEAEVGITPSQIDRIVRGSAGVTASKPARIRTAERRNRASGSDNDPGKPAVKAGTEKVRGKSGRKSRTEKERTERHGRPDAKTEKIGKKADSLSVSFGTAAPTGEEDARERYLTLKLRDLTGEDSAPGPEAAPKYRRRKPAGTKPSDSGGKKRK